MKCFYRLLWIALMVSGLGILSGCAGPAVKPEHQLPLVKNQPYEGTQQTMDYQLEYRYVFSSGGSSEPDQIEFTGNLTPRRGFETFILRLHLLDASGNVLATHALYAPGSNQGAGRSTINRKIEVPPGAVMIGFSHFAHNTDRTGGSKTDSFNRAAGIPSALDFFGMRSQDNRIRSCFFPRSRA